MAALAREPHCLPGRSQLSVRGKERQGRALAAPTPTGLAADVSKVPGSLGLSFPTCQIGKGWSGLG